MSTPSRQRIPRIAAFSVPVILLFGMAAHAQAANLAAAHRLLRRRDNVAHTSIVGGKYAERGAFPWLADVADFRGEVVGECTGTVVAPNLVLTAGHCVVDDETGEIHEPGGFEIFTGGIDWNSTTEGEDSGVLRVLVYPDYYIGGSLEGWGDVALLQLSTPTKSPAIRLTDSEIWEPGTGAIIAGWGETHYGQEQATEYLHWARTVVQSKEWCRANTSGFHPNGQVCTIDAPSYESATCFGDSGGPLLAQEPGTGELVEIGITHSGDAFCSTSRPDVFTRSDLVASWVAARIKELNPPPPPQPASPSSRSPAAQSESLPKMGFSQASRFVRRGLAEGFRGTFMRRRYYRKTCRRVEAAKIRCGVSWTHGPNDYYGSITVYYLRDNGELLWNDRYTIHRVNDYCYFYSGHRRRCKVHTWRR